MLLFVTPGDFVFEGLLFAFTVFIRIIFVRITIFRKRVMISLSWFPSENERGRREKDNHIISGWLQYLPDSNLKIRINQAQIWVNYWDNYKKRCIINMVCHADLTKHTIWSWRRISYHPSWRNIIFVQVHFFFLLQATWDKPQPQKLLKFFAISALKVA